MARLNTRSQAGTKADDGTRARAGGRTSTRQKLTERYVSPPPATLQERLQDEEQLARTMTGKKKKTKTLFDESPLANEKKLSSATATSLRRTKSTKTRTKALSEQQFDIFADSDGTTERDTPKAKKMETPLKIARTNSMILPLPQQHQHQPRARTSRKSELYNYDKENDPLEEELDPDMDSEATTSLSRNPSDASTSASSVRLSPARRRNAQREQERQQFTRYRQPQREESEDENDNSFNSLDEFIVSDNDEPSFHETSSENESDSEEEHKASPQPPTPPTQRRRLLRGRRPNPAVELENALRESARRPDLRLEPSLPASFGIPSPSPKLDGVSRKLFQEETDMSNEMDRLNLQEDPSSQLQDDLVGAVSGFESPTDLRPQSPFKIPPSSPTNSVLRSPAKDRVLIPPTPHRESTDAFWNLEVTNNWIDSHSPRKVTSLLQEFDDSDEDSSTMSKQSRPQSPTKPPSKTALKKAEVEAKKAAIARKKSFDNRKAAFAEDFLKALDDAVSGGEVQKRSAETGGVRIVWSKTLQTTAGRANWKRDRAVVDSRPVTPGDSSSGSEKSSITTKHYATIELAERIIDDEDRLLNTLAHEYCHLANYIVSNVRNQPHGASFQAWGRKCKEALRDHPVYGGRVEVTTRHSYKIDFKYVWTCVDCCQNYGRHSKSINPGKHRCGKCRGLLQQIKPKPRSVSPRKKQPAAPTGVVNDVAKDLGVIDLSP